MATIKKIGKGPYNPQKASAYVGKGVLRKGGAITPVPNGPLIKKDGTSLKKGGIVKKAQTGKRVNKYMTDEEYDNMIKKQKEKLQKENPKFYRTLKDTGNIDPGIEIIPEKDSRKKRRVFSEDGNLQYLRKGGKVKKGGTVVKVGGQTHKVFKNKKGDVVVDHTAGIPAGKWDKINLTKKSKAKTVKQGVASVRKWHKENPDYYKKKK